MNAIGIIRRVDDLGRVVVPKELRRKLRWQTGTPVEIFTGDDGYVGLKKYTAVGEDSLLAQKMADSMAQSCKCAVFVSDKDHIVAIAGSQKVHLLGKEISPELENAINARKLIKTESMPLAVSLDNDHVYKFGVVAPIVTEGCDCEGAVAIMSNEKPISDAEVLLARTVSAFLSDRLEF